METTNPTPPMESPLSIKRLLRVITISLIAYPFMLFAVMKIVTTVAALAMESYAEIGAALPPVTLLAIRVTDFLTYDGLILTFTAGPLLAGIHAGLTPFPQRQKRFARVVAAALILGTVGLLVAIALPLFGL